MADSAYLVNMADFADLDDILELANLACLVDLDDCLLLLAYILRPCIKYWPLGDPASSAL